MSRSIVPGKDIFQYAIRYLPTGKYLRKGAYSFSETDIPACYVSEKVAAASIENNFKRYGKYNPKYCKIVKFVLRMEEVKEQTEEEIEYQKELTKIETLRKVLGEHRWEEIEETEKKNEIYLLIRHLNDCPISRGCSLHCSHEDYQTRQGVFRLMWCGSETKDHMPGSISEKVDYNWQKQIQDLKDKYGIR